MSNLMDKKKQVLYSKLISWIFLSLMIFTITKRLIPSSINSTIIAALISFPIPFIILIRIIFINKLKIKRGFIVILILLITIVYLISLIRGVPYEKIIFYYIFTLLGLFLLYFTYLSNDFSLLYDELNKKSFYITLFSILILFVNKTENPYNMRFSYILSISLYFQSIGLIKEGNKKNIILILLDLFLIVMFGSRGPLLCYAIFLVLFVLFENIKKYVKGIFCIVLLNIYLFLDKIILGIANIIDRFNISSRTLYLLVNDIQHSSGRDIIQKNSLYLLKQNSIFGLGIAGEFKYMEDYPHNIILDLMLHWGIIFGSLVFFLLVIFISKAFLKSSGKERLLMLIFISYGFITLLFSGTYLSWDGFYILLGLSLRILSRKKEEILQ